MRVFTFFQNIAINYIVTTMYDIGVFTFFTISSKQSQSFFFFFVIIVNERREMNAQKDI
jgi:hypothetical protein